MRDCYRRQAFPFVRMAAHTPAPTGGRRNKLYSYRGYMAVTSCGVSGLIFCTPFRPERKKSTERRYSPNDRPCEP